MSDIFINYRHSDTQDSAGRLYEALSARFGSDAVFLDISGIAPGQDIAQEIRRRVGACRVLLALIGRDWLTAVDTEGRPRLAMPRDAVRLEIAAALAAPRPVIPVLLHGVSVPREDQLPRDLHPLAGLKGVSLRHGSWDTDLADLVAELSRHVRTGSPPQRWRRRLRGAAEFVSLARRIAFGLLALATLGLLGHWLLWVEVPPLEGLPVAAATLILDSRGIPFDQTPSEQQAHGLASLVVAQRPLGGRHGIRFSRVLIQVARGSLADLPPPTQSAARDAELRRSILGTWRQVRSFNGYLIDQQTTYAPEGRTEVRGVATFFGVKVNYWVRGVWQIAAGRIDFRVQSSSIPSAVPTGYEAAGEILAVTADELAARDLLDGQVYVDLRAP